MRMRIPALAAAAVLAFGLAACGNDSATAPGGSPAATATTAPVTQAPFAEGGQSTPELAAEALVAAFANNNPRGACAVVAADGKPVENHEEMLSQCQEVIRPILDQLGDTLSSLQGTTVEGATIDGDMATFENATVTPEQAKALIEGRTAVKIGDKWYISQ